MKSIHSYRVLHLIVVTIFTSSVLYFAYALLVSDTCTSNTENEKNLVVSDAFDMSPKNESVIAETKSQKKMFTRQYWRESFKANAQNLGELDVEELLPLLSHLFEKHFQFTAFRIMVDIGANVGRTSDLFVKLFADAECRLYAEMYPGEWHQSCRDDQHGPLILSFEPIGSNFNRIKERCDRSLWKHALWAGMKAAVGELDEKVTFYTSGAAGDEQASQDREAATGNTISETVPKFTLDKFFNDGIVESNVTWYGATRTVFPNMIPTLTGFMNPQLNIFMLKIDTEGYDYFVLEGARQLLASKRIKFIAFEYNSKWFTQGRTHTLKQTVAELYENYSYECYWILKNLLIPISGIYWDDEYEIRDWSNVMCGITGDAALDWLVNSYNKDIK
jgi:hypothetical protein